MNSWWLFKAKYCLYIYIYRERERQTDRQRIPKRARNYLSRIQQAGLQDNSDKKKVWPERHFIIKVGHQKEQKIVYELLVVI